MRFFMYICLSYTLSYIKTGIHSISNSSDYSFIHIYVNTKQSEIGAQAPLGFFDPLGLLKDADQNRFDRLRYVETKHGEKF